jgi:hypothetical protein
MAMVLIHVQMFLLRVPDPSSPEGMLVAEWEWRNLQHLLIQIRCVCRQTPVVELMTDRLISRIGIVMARHRVRVVQTHAMMYLTDLRGMVALFGGLPMPGAEPAFGEQVVDVWTVNQVAREIQLGGNAMDIEEDGLENYEGAEDDEGTEDDEI